MNCPLGDGLNNITHLLSYDESGKVKLRSLGKGKALIPTQKAAGWLRCFAFHGAHCPGLELGQLNKSS